MDSSDHHLRLSLLRSIAPLIDSNFPSPPPSPISSSSNSKSNGPQPASILKRSSGSSGVDKDGEDQRDAKRLKDNSFSGGLQMNVSGGPASSTAKPDDWKLSYSKERYKKIATLYRTKGRELKHAGDRTARSEGSSTVLSILQQTEAILFYIFSFWCDDQPSKVCQAFNWQSIFALISFVKKAAGTIERSDRLKVVVGICLRMEAYAVQTLSNHEQKTLSYQASLLLVANKPSPPLSITSPPLPNNSILSPSGSATSSALISTVSLPIPPSSNISPNLSTSGTSSSSSKPAPTSVDILRQYHRASVEIFKSQRLFDESSTYLTLSSLALYLLPSSISTYSAVAQSKIDSLGPSIISQSASWRTENNIGRIGLLDRSWGYNSNGLEVVRAVAAAREVLRGVARVEGVEWVEAVVEDC